MAVMMQESLIDDILDLVKVNHGVLTLNLKPCNIVKFL